MKNYSRKTNKKQARYRTPSPFRSSIKFKSHTLNLKSKKNELPTRNKKFAQK